MELSPDLKPYVDEAKRSPLSSKMIDLLGKPLKTSGEIFPMDMVPVIATGKSRKQMVFPMVWGFDITGLDRPVVNARIETAKDKPSFRDAWLSRRCIIPASCYFEWEHFIKPNGKKKTGDKYAIQPKNCTVTYLTGLYQLQEYRGLTYPVFTVLTREPSESVKAIHDRMPVVMPEDAIADWINPEKKAEDTIPLALTDMNARKETGRYEQLRIEL